MHEVQDISTPCRYNTNTIHTNIHIWAHSPRLPVTYNSVMKHKTHTVEASGAGKDRATDKLQTGTERQNEMENKEEKDKDKSVKLKRNINKKGKEAEKVGK